MSDLPPPSGPPPAGYGPPPTYPPGAYRAPAPGPPRASLASFGERFLAELVDGLILGATMLVAVLTAILALVLGPSHRATCPTYRYSEELGQQTSYQLCSRPDGGTVAIAVLLGLIGVAATIAVYVYYFRREGRTGQTWGRSAMGIRLLDASSGLPIGAGRAFGRFLLASYVSGSVCYLGYLWMLWDDRNQTWHDKIMNTVVVKG